MKKKRTARSLFLAAYFNRIQNPTPQDRFAQSYTIPLFVWAFLKR